MKTIVRFIYRIVAIRRSLLQRRYTFRPAGTWFLVMCAGLYTFRPAGAKERLFSVYMSGFARSTRPTRYRIGCAQTKSLCYKEVAIRRSLLQRKTIHCDREFAPTKKYRVSQALPDGQDTRITGEVTSPLR